jgi:DNA-binding CsgD family transcriptional regulator
MAVAPIRLASTRVPCSEQGLQQNRDGAITCEVDGRHFTGFTVEAWRNREWKEANSKRGGVPAQHGLLRFGGRTFFLVLSPETHVLDDGPDDRLGSLTARELQIAHRISDGACDKVIAHTLGISEYTVREHVRRIFSKLRVSKRTAIVRLLWRNNRARPVQQGRAAVVPKNGTAGH